MLQSSKLQPPFHKEKCTKQQAEGYKLFDILAHKQLKTT